MTLCDCGCGETLEGKEQRFRNDKHRAKFWTDARKKGAAKGNIHAAPVVGNPRLEPLMLAIQARGKMTSLELHELTGSMAIHSDIAEIRERGYPVSKAKYLRTENGRKVYEYRWGIK